MTTQYLRGGRLTRSANEGRGILAEGIANQASCRGPRPKLLKQEIQGSVAYLGKWKVTEILSARAGWA